MPKKVTLVSNYYNTRVALYINGNLRYEEHARNAYSYVDGKRTLMTSNGTFDRAADLMTILGVKYFWYEANPSWLQKRQHFPKKLSEVKFG